MNDAAAALQAALKSGGPITFARFMELALYAPGLGYYEQREHTPGCRGDFFTSVSVGCLFGELLAHQFAQWLSAAPQDERLALVEAGAHDGRLAADVLKTLQRVYPSLHARLDFYFLEPSDTRAAWQQETFNELGLKGNRTARWEDFPRPLRGVIYSNELLDAMPVHRLGWNAARQEWFEWGVEWRCGGGSWIRLPLSAPELPPDLPQALLEVLPDGFTIEVPVAALQWWRQAAACLAPGSRLMTLDYGTLADLPLDPRRPRGSLRAYWRHTVQDDLLARPGEQDLTADVPFAAVAQAGQAEGLVTETLQKQGPFLTRLVLDMGPKLQWSPAQRRQFMTLTHPQHLGERFCVLVQRRPEG